MPNPALTPNRDEYYVQTGSMFENPYGVPHDEIVAQLLEMPSEVAAQVIFGKYVESSGLVFTGELIQMLFDRQAEHYGNAWDHKLRITSDRWQDEDAIKMAQAIPWEHRRYKYATGIDFARKTDFTVIFTIDLTYRPARVVYYRRLNRVPWESIYREVGRTIDLFGASALADSTGMAGDVIMDNLDSRLYCSVHDRTVMMESGFCRNRDFSPLGGCDPKRQRRLSCVEGYPFSASSKNNLVEHLRNILSVGFRAGSDDPFGWLRCPPIVAIEEEMAFYAWDDKGLDTDTVMALALAAWQGLEDVPQAALIGSAYGE
ncbi:MAG: hypothetical protein H0U53_11145 [Actinobacteria bacterium]|nr:hypothetical protein [Actinomycetota bacterium]